MKQTDHITRQVQIHTFYVLDFFERFLSLLHVHRKLLTMKNVANFSACLKSRHWIDQINVRSTSHRIWLRFHYLAEDKTQVLLQTTFFFYAFSRPSPTLIIILIISPTWVWCSVALFETHSNVSPISAPGWWLTEDTINNSPTATWFVFNILLLHLQSIQHFTHEESANPLRSLARQRIFLLFIASLFGGERQHPICRVCC